jgi:hypothetical protein
LRKAIPLLWLFGLWAGALLAAPGPGEAAPAVSPWPVVEVLNRYFAVNQQQVRVHEGRTEMDIKARLPRLKKEASLHAIQEITPSGEIKHTGVRGDGDRTVIKDVIARYLSAEEEASKGLADHQGKPLSISISPENYRFRQKAVLTVDGRRIYIFHVLPKKDRLGLFKGEIWIDGDTGVPVREAGQLAKNPSMFLRKVEFVRDYEVRGGRAYLTRVESIVDTRLVGRAELVVRYSNHSAMTSVEAAQGGAGAAGG